MRAPPRRLKLGLAYAGILLSCWLVFLNLDLRNHLAAQRMRTHERALLVDEQLELARQYAPWILHAAHPARGRQDVPTRIDFDGDLLGDNNWDDFPFFYLPPTVYYSVVESETHWFLTYHLFHPRDWARVRLGLNDTHENDGENLQVVVDKAGGQPVLLFTQAHFEGVAWKRADYAAQERAGYLRGELLACDDEGRFGPEGTHSAVYVESGGHGIHGVGHADVAVIEIEGASTPTLTAPGWQLYPAQADEPVGEPDPALAAAGESAPRYAYQLASLPATLWAGVQDGSLIGHSRLFDGAVDYADEALELELPRYYEADRFSGPLGDDRGISPFAVDFEFDEGPLGALLFDPAQRWNEVLDLPEGWSLVYIAHPFRQPR